MYETQSCNKSFCPFLLYCVHALPYSIEHFFGHQGTLSQVARLLVAEL